MKKSYIREEKKNLKKKKPFKLLLIYKETKKQKPFRT